MYWLANDAAYIEVHSLLSSVVAMKKKSSRLLKPWQLDNCVALKLGGGGLLASLADLLGWLTHTSNCSLLSSTSSSSALLDSSLSDSESSYSLLSLCRSGHVSSSALVVSLFVLSYISLAALIATLEGSFISLAALGATLEVNDGLTVPMVEVLLLSGGELSLVALGATLDGDDSDDSWLDSVSVLQSYSLLWSLLDVIEDESSVVEELSSSLLWSSAGSN